MYIIISCTLSLNLNASNSCINCDKYPADYGSLFFASEVISTA
jgi:hypothetical protein